MKKLREAGDDKTKVYEDNIMKNLLRDFRKQLGKEVAVQIKRLSAKNKKNADKIVE